MFNPWILLGVALAWAASLGVVGMWQNKAGSTQEKVKWEAREVQITNDANAKILASTTRERKIEKEAGEAIAVIAEKLEGVKASVQKERDRLIAGVRTRTVVLRVPVTSSPCSIRSAESGTPATPSVGDGGASAGFYAEIDEPTSEALIGLASDADQVVGQLIACQGVIRADRKAVNAGAANGK